MQQRIGPNRVGPRGWAQSLADGLKLALKEDIIPALADKPVYLLAPLLSADPGVPRLLGHPVRPDGLDRRQRDGAAAHRPAGRRAVRARLREPRRVRHRAGRLVQRLDLPAARRAALGRAGHLLRDRHGAGARRGLPLRRLAVDQRDRRGAAATAGSSSRCRCRFVIYVIAITGETNRAPFDLPEAESELVGGFHTEYTSLKFAMFFLAEYINIVTVSALATTLFLGGWQPTCPFSPGRRSCPRAGSRSSGSCPRRSVFIFFFVWLRGTLPRMRYDAVHALRLEGARPGRPGLDPARRRRSAPRPSRSTTGARCCSAVGAVFAVVLVVFYLLPGPAGAEQTSDRPGTDLDARSTRAASRPRRWTSSSRRRPRSLARPAP